MLRLCIMFVFTVLSVSLFSCSNKMSPEEAQKVLNAFYTDNVPEEINDRHLVDAGKAIVPYLLVEIKKKDMPKRRYAIGALEKIKDKRALPILIEILQDHSEIFYFRDDALRAVWHIDKKLGEEFAKKLTGQYPSIDRTVQLLREGKI